jgi:hypothetical protein
MLVPTCSWWHRRERHFGHRKRYGVVVPVVSDVPASMLAAQHVPEAGMTPSVSMRLTSPGL